MTPIRNQHGELLDFAFSEGSIQDTYIIMGHGVTGNKDRPLLIAVAHALVERGYPVLRFSFSGNGDSEGKFTDSTISKEVADLRSVLDHVGQGKKIIYIGHSMGAAVGALTAARDERIDVLVSLAGMVHTADFCQREFGQVTPDGGCMWDEPDCPLSQSFVDDMQQIGSVLEAAKSVKLPWLLLHGSEDDVVMLQDSEDLIGVLKNNAQLVNIDGAGHSFAGFEEHVAEKILAWLETV